MIGIGMGGNSRSLSEDFDRALEMLSEQAGGCDVVATFDEAACLDTVRHAALRRGARFLAISLEALIQRNGDCATISRRSTQHSGVASIAEASALAATGEGSRLVVARQIVGSVTIAVARSRD